MKTNLFVAVLTLALVSGCSKPNADELFAKGNDYAAKGLTAEAIVQYRLAVQADPKRGDIRQKLADAYLKSRNGTLALRESVLAADLLPNDVAAQVRAGQLLLLSGAFEDAKGRADKALAVDPGSVDALVLKANALAQLKDLDAAILEYQEALALDPGADAVYASIGAIQLARGQTQEAEATFRKAVDVAPRSVPARLALASFLWASSRVQDAESALKDALKLEPANLGANRAIGAFYMAIGRGADAEPYFKTIAAAASSGADQLALADYYLVQRRPEDAKAILAALSKQADFFEPATLRLAAIEAIQNNRPRASALVRTVLDKTPKYAPARVFEMRLLFADRKLDEATAAATALIKDEGNSAAASDAYFVIGGIEAWRDRTDEAMTAYEQALRIQPRSLTTALALAQLNLRLGSPDKAAMFARQVLAVQPKNPSARAFVVRADLMRNDLASAAAGLVSLEKDYPNTVPVLNLVAARDLKAGKVAAARATYARVAEMAPDNLEALEGLVIVDVNSRRAADAAARVDAALKRMPPTAELYVVAARAHAAAGNLTRTEELLKSAIEREPARLAAYNLLGQLYVSQKRLPDARDQFVELLKRNPRSVPVSTMLGMVYEAQQDLAAAEQQYQKTLNIDPTAAVAANNLAWIYVASNRNLDQALQLAQTALKSLPEEPHVNDTIGWIYYRKGMHAQAVRHLELSVKRDPSDPATHYHLGMAYLGLGEVIKGKKALTDALSRSTTFEGAGEARKMLGGDGR